MKSVLFTIILMSLGLAAAPITHIPVPTCFPCNDEPAQATVAVNHIPVPTCFPCNDEPLQLTSAADSRFFLRRSQL
jgi:hypothetical protein